LDGRYGVTFPQASLHLSLVGPPLRVFAHAQRQRRDRGRRVGSTCWHPQPARIGVPSVRAPRASAHSRAPRPTPLPLNRATVAPSRTPHRHHRCRRICTPEPARDRHTRRCAR
jgi:hypothetical protein